MPHTLPHGNPTELPLHSGPEPGNQPAEADGRAGHRGAAVGGTDTRPRGQGARGAEGRPAPPHLRGADLHHGRLPLHLRVRAGLLPLRQRAEVDGIAIAQSVVTD